MKTLKDFGFNGESALEEVILESKYGSIEQAIASLTLFTHPDTVMQTGGKGLFRIRRYRAREERGQIVESERVVLCDNDSPTRAFLWSNGMTHQQYSHVQFNHIYQLSYDPEYYTSLANICVTPAFLSKLTDGNHRIQDLLKYRSYDLYGFVPMDEQCPLKPDCYGSLQWADTCNYNGDLKGTIEKKLIANALSRIAISVERFGWLID